MLSAAGISLAGLAVFSVGTGRATTVVAARPPAARAAAPGTGTARMRERLRRIDAEMSPAINRFMNGRHVEMLRRTLSQPLDPATQVPLRGLLAESLLYAGRPQEALAELEPLAAMWDGMRQFARPGTARHAQDLRALAWLRIGEQSNCILHHGSESCILPIEGNGVHREQEGSRQALAELRAILEREPDDLKSRWLLNIAAMTVGEWPDRVDERFRIGREVFASDHDIGRFKDVAIPSGMRTRGLAGGVAIEDFDGDGDLDIFMTHMAFDASPVYFRNDGDGSFSDRSEDTRLEGITGGLNLSPADYDNDGDTDLMVLRGAWMQEGGEFPNSLLRNHGDASFEDVTEEAGVLRIHPTQVGAWADYDGDGWLDLFVGNESTPGRPRPSELWHNRGNGTFEDRSRDLPDANLGFVKGADWGDIDNDGRPDLVVSVYGKPNVLLHNRGPAGSGAGAGAAWSFADVSAAAGIDGPSESFACWWFDYDNDGWEDILINGYSTTGISDVAALYLGLPNDARTPKLYRNRHDGTFEDVSRATRIDRVALPMGANFGDLDNDGWLDAYFATGEPGLATLMPNRMFRNNAGREFQDITTSGGFGHLQKGHGVAFADLDEDGDQEVIAQMGGAFEGDVAFSLLFENPGHRNHWITVRLQGVRSNRSAFGARLRARIAENGAERDIYLTAGTGGSFGGSSSQQEMGLGQASRLIELEVRWPTSGLVQHFPDLAMDRIYSLIEGGELKPVEARPVRLGGARE